MHVEDREVACRDAAHTYTMSPRWFATAFGWLLSLLLLADAWPAATLDRKPYEGYKVHVIFSNHLVRSPLTTKNCQLCCRSGCVSMLMCGDAVHRGLQDVGFTDLDSKVIDLYFHHHLPNAVRLADHQVMLTRLRNNAACAIAWPVYLGLLFCLFVHAYVATAWQQGCSTAQPLECD